MRETWHAEGNSQYLAVPPGLKGIDKWGNDEVIAFFPVTLGLTLELRCSLFSPGCGSTNFTKLGTREAAGKPSPKRRPIFKGMDGETAKLLQFIKVTLWLALGLANGVRV